MKTTGSEGTKLTSAVNRVTLLKPWRGFVGWFHRNKMFELISTVSIIVAVMNYCYEADARDHARLNQDWEALSKGQRDSVNLARDDALAHLVSQGKAIGHIDLQNAEMSGIDLEGAWLRGVNLKYAHLPAAKLGCRSLWRGRHCTDLSYAHFECAQLTRANLAGAVLVAAHFADVLADSVDFDGTILKQADLRRAHLDHAILVRANLDSADLSGAVLTSADLNEASLRDAKFRQADLRGATLPTMRSGWHSVGDLTGANVKSAVPIEFRRWAIDSMSALEDTATSWGPSDDELRVIPGRC
jgi:uncharacterized protein YjbI with pentapeptide repeats